MPPPDRRSRETAQVAEADERVSAIAGLRKRIGARMHVRDDMHTHAPTVTDSEDVAEHQEHEDEEQREANGTAGHHAELRAGRHVHEVADAGNLE